MRRPGLHLAFAFVLAAALAACGSSNKGLDIDANQGNCVAFGNACTAPGDCCSGTCTNNLCAVACAPGGSMCTAGPDCCSGTCTNGTCTTAQCTSDNAACSKDTDCCSGMCSASGTCTPLNPSCKTNGNQCAGSGACCSKYCSPAGVCENGSYCIQNGDACTKDAECCGGLCNVGPTGVGTCTQPYPGATNCQAGVDGTICAGCGDCCSRLCVPYGSVNICAPAEGCRIDGDLCQKDTDCCGAAGSGLPGDGNVICLKENATDPVGICRNPNGCDPEGDVCHYKNYSTCGNSSARDNCCGGTGNSGVCQLDPQGVPRCYGLGTSCRNPGDTCSFSGDCCNGLPCVPDSSGVLHCGTTACQNPSGACSSDADCCNGETCSFPPGSVQGTCGQPQGSCSLAGQSCSDTQPCCPGGSLECDVAGANPAMKCPTGGTNCVCQVPVF